MIWTEEQTDKLKKLVKAGLSASEIGRELGVTKNSVIGRIHRVGLSGRDYPRQGQPRELKAEWSREASNKRWASTPRREAKPPLQKVEKIATLIVSNAVSAPLSKALLIDALTERHCRWIDGHPKHSPTYCGRETLPGTSWCAWHHSRVYQRGSQHEIDQAVEKALGRQPKGDRELLVVEAA